MTNEEPRTPSVATWKIVLPAVLSAAVPQDHCGTVQDLCSIASAEPGVASASAAATAAADALNPALMCPCPLPVSGGVDFRVMHKARGARPCPFCGKTTPPEQEKPRGPESVPARAVGVVWWCEAGEPARTPTTP
ncbi:hypothetical protein GCM10010428_68160 [Actinosynnema pretiosum subsp. pretiosum]